MLIVAAPAPLQSAMLLLFVVEAIATLALIYALAKRQGDDE